MRSHLVVVMVVILCCREKPLSEWWCCPYPKPTLVVGLSILRLAGELWLRNSANCPRNFGRWGATLGRRLLRLVGVGWSQRLGESDCLLKTQVRAKTVKSMYTD